MLHHSNHISTFQTIPSSRSPCVTSLTTKATPVWVPSSGGQGLSAANARRYAAKTAPPTDKKPRPAEDLSSKNADFIRQHMVPNNKRKNDSNSSLAKRKLTYLLDWNCIFSPQDKKHG